MAERGGFAIHSWRSEDALPGDVRCRRVDPAPCLPAVVSLPIREFARTAVRSYRFQPAGRVDAVAAPRPAPQPSSASASAARSVGRDAEEPSASRRHRLEPPRDVVKLADRFFYLLQPDLETLVSTGEIAFSREPYPFQMAGMAFLLPRHEAVLADEMGLGKSMQAISSIRLLVRLGQARRVLVVCPKGLVSNWRRELAEWAAELPVAVVEGDPERRRWAWGLRDVPVTLAHYESVVRDRAILEADVAPYDLVVLDEAQRIKNRASQTSAAVRSVRRTRSWALTGTPIENAPSDLVALFDFVSPGLVDESMGPRALGSAVSDHVLRRKKEDVLEDLPPRTDRDERIELADQQRETYRLAEEEGVLRLAAMGRTVTIQHVFELVLRLKQICNFDTATGASAKLERLEAELEEVRASGRKAIVFSQWVDTLLRLEGRLSRFGASTYHGGLSTAARDAAIKAFREDPDRSVLLLSYGAGAVGLNLQFSQYVFLFDRWWNPAVEDQAINRAHRIGAAGAVTVTRFLCCDTIEERIDRILESKRSLSEAILTEAGSAAAGAGPTGLTAQELFALFGLSDPGPSINDGGRLRPAA